MSLVDFLRSDGFDTTCSLHYPEENGIAFSSSIAVAQAALLTVYERIALIAPTFEFPNIEYVPNITLVQVEDPRFEFAMIHNQINEGRPAAPNGIHPSAEIHPSAVVGPPGSWVVESYGSLHRGRHMGNVVIGKNVRIGACSVIHRALIDSTIIRHDATIGACCTVGHQAEIGARTILAAQVGVAGSCKIGEGVFLGIGSTIKNGVYICDNAIIGAGAVVVKDIVEPGKYAGVPAKRIEKRA